ncbi:MAG: hypothetical protein QOD00_2431 [Blastocatellia bacterium]|jgi:amino acid adenylation domain-containing protein|nr:hypothetical protein [Blastocatellia bacterium]
MNSKNGPDHQQRMPLSSAKQLLLEKRRRGKAGGGFPVTAIPLRPPDAAVPLSFAQLRLWLLDQLVPLASVYNLSFVVRLQGSLDVSALHRSLNEVVRRHESLRTTFAAVDGQPIQVIAPELILPLPLLDLRELSGAKQQARVENLIESEAQAPFDLTQGPLLRASLLRLGAQAHVLLLSMHHIISDGWSMGIFIREVTTLYRAFIEGRESPLPAPPLQYADYAYWQQQAGQAQALAAQLAYWKEQLASIPPLLELPTDYSRPSVQSYSGAHHSRFVPAPLSAQLKGLCGREEVTLFMLLLAAFKLLLYRYTKQEDLVVGTAIAGRSHSELESLIGFFINTLALRTDISGDPSFAELLRRVRAVTLAAYAHQEVSFEKVLETVAVERTLSHTPLFQVFFNMLNYPHAPLHMPGLKVEIPTSLEVGSKFDLTLYVEESEEGIKLDLLYNSDLFAAERMEEMLDQFLHLLEQIALSTSHRLSQYSLVTARARSILPDPRSPLSAEWEGPVHELFSGQAQRHGVAPAIMDGKERWTYAEVERHSDRVARYLDQHHVGREQVVAIYGHRSAALVWAILGVLKAGAAFTILDPAYPVLHLLECLRIARPTGWLQLEEAGPLPEALELFLEDTPELCRLTLSSQTTIDENELPGEPSGISPQAKISPRDLAYISFTSGTTGKPKGIMGLHGSLTHFLPWLRKTFKLSESDRFSMLSGLSHDPLHRDIFTPLQLGAAICIPDAADFEAAGRLAAWMSEAQVSIAHLTPAMGQLLTERVPWANPRDMPSLRFAFFIGDVLTRRDVSRLRELAPSVTCVNFYGSTETQRAVGYFIVPDNFIASPPAPGQDEAVPERASRGTPKEIIPVGRGIEDVQLLVLNDARQMAGIGEACEIYLRSPHIARGYAGDEALTHERFLVNPFTQAVDDWLYKTGDLGRYLADGNVEPLGRLDNQVKIRGFRVEPGEIEATLAAFPGIREALVLARQSAVGDKQLVAYLACAEERQPDAAELRVFLKERLPEYMTPTRFLMLKRLPHTPNGKVDRKALALIQLNQPSPEGAFQNPRTEVEERLLTVWAGVLGRRQVSIHDDFFNLGGHSLLAAQLVSRIRHLFSIELPLRALFEAPTVSGLAERVERAISAKHGLRAAPIHPVSRETNLPLSYAQQRMWILHQLDPDGAAYNIHAAVHLTGTLDVTALKGTLDEIIRRHEILRTVFQAVDELPVQVISASHELKMPLVDLSNLSGDELEREVHLLAREDSLKPFDLATGPLLRVTLLKLEALEHVVLLTMHHIISDGWSIGVLTREVGAIYAGLRANQASPLSELPIQYADFADWQRKWLRGEVLETELSYWKKQLAGMPALELPFDRARPAVQSFRGARQTVILPQKMTDDLLALSRRQGVTLFMTLLAAFQTLLYRYTGQRDISIGTPIAHRHHEELEGLIGFFVNTLVLRADLSNNLTFVELLNRTREVALEAYAHQNLPFEQLVDELQPERNMSLNPMFQVGMVLQNAPAPPLHLPGLTLKTLEIQTTTAIFDLNLLMREGQDGLMCSLEYSTDLFDATTITRMLDNFRTLLESVLVTPGERLDALSLLTEAEREQVLTRWNSTRADYTQELNLVQLFEAQVERTPDKTAIIFEDEMLTYQELNLRANQVASYLRDFGVGPEALVGICVERSIEMVLGVLGVLKAGGAYVPLDRAYPKERLAYMLEDTQAPVLLTQGHLLPGLPQYDGKVVLLDADWHHIARHSADNWPAPVANSNIAYVTYTSGSTGKPKGIAMPHRPLINLLTWMCRQTQLPPGARTLQFASLSFDVSFQDMFSTWLSGGAVVLIREESRRDIAGLARLITKQGIHRLFIPAVALQQLAEGFCTGEDFYAPLLKVIAGSEQLQLTRAISRMFTELKGCSLHNEYGPSEAHVVTALALPASPASWPERPPIGRPISNIQIYVLDNRMEPVPIGVTGELYIGGDGLARGYLNSPDLTADKFIPNPYALETGARLYKTGDLARWLVDGNLEFLGRLDHQVKIRGFRIELGEVEAVLGQHPSVREMVVIAREETSGSKRLVAYLVPERDTAPTVRELRGFLLEKLPDYMIPSAFVTLSALPLTPNGKVDRKALPSPERTRPELEKAYVAPRTNLERALTSLLMQLLERDRIGVDDNFFELGGNSLLATQAISRLRRIFQMELPLRYIFEVPTIAGLAEKMVGDEPQQGYLEKVSAIFNDLEQLSESETRMSLQNERHFTENDGG